MRTTMITIREKAVAARPWLPWLVPGVIGGLDALNLIAPCRTLYLFMLAITVTITTSALVCRRTSHAAESAQVDRAMLLGYQLGLEHRDEIQAAERRPVAVGENTIVLSRRLQPVRPPADTATNGHVYRSETAATTASMPSQASRRAHLASAPPPQPQP